MDILAAVYRWSVTCPERAAQRGGGREISYRELEQQSNQLAAYLRAHLPAGERAPVAVIGHKEPEMLVGFLGAVKAGRAYIPIERALPAPRVQVMLDTAGAALTLTPEAIRAVLALSEPRDVAAPAALAPNDPWYIIFTSGSSGEPKGVVITAGGLESFVDWMLAEQGFAGQAETFLNQAPFSFDLSVMDLYLSLATGGTLFSVTQEEIAEPRRLYQALAGSGVTTWVSTPSFAQLCLAEPSFTAARLPRVRRFLFCGETLSPEVAAELLERFPAAAVWNTYGPTEATCATTSIRIDPELLRQFAPLPIGYAKPTSRVVILAADGAPVLEGEAGEIVIAGPNVSPGYLGQPELNARVFFQLDGQPAYRTGDWGHETGGLLFFDGRSDNQVKLHGYRIELGDVEANLRILPNVQDALAAAVHRNGRPDHLAAFIILRQPGNESDYEQARALRRELARRVPAYMVPRRFIFLRQFPLTPNGKADRRKLIEFLE